MANWSILKNAIADIVKTNDNQEITGEALQSVLTSMINTLGEYAGFAGVALPTTSPSVPDGPVFFLAATPGAYPNFDNAAVHNGEIVVFRYVEDVWVKEVLFSGETGGASGTGLIELVASEKNPVDFNELRATGNYLVTGDTDYMKNYPVDTVDSAILLSVVNRSNVDFTQTAVIAGVSEVYTRTGNFINSAQATLWDDWTHTVHVQKVTSIPASTGSGIFKSRVEEETEFYGLTLKEGDEYLFYNYGGASQLQLLIYSELDPDTTLYKKARFYMRANGDGDFEEITLGGTGGGGSETGGSTVVVSDETAIEVAAEEGQIIDLNDDMFKEDGVYILSGRVQDFKNLPDGEPFLYYTHKNINGLIKIRLTVLKMYDKPSNITRVKQTLSLVMNYGNSTEEMYNNVVYSRLVFINADAKVPYWHRELFIREAEVISSFDDFREPGIYRLAQYRVEGAADYKVVNGINFHKYDTCVLLVSKANRPIYGYDKDKGYDIGNARAQILWHIPMVWSGSSGEVATIYTRHQVYDSKNDALVWTDFVPMGSGGNTAVNKVFGQVEVINPQTDTGYVYDFNQFIDDGEYKFVYSTHLKLRNAPFEKDATIRLSVLKVNYGANGENYRCAQTATCVSLTSSGALTDGVFYRCLTYENGNLSGTSWKQIASSYE